MRKLGFLKAIRGKCLDCAEDKTAIRECPMNDCTIYPYRMGKGAVKGVSRLKAIRNKCLWCMNGVKKEIRFCQSPDCALFLHRHKNNDLVPLQECL